MKKNVFYQIFYNESNHWLSMANALGMLCLHQRQGHCGHNVTKLHVSRKATSQFLSYVSVSHTQTIFQTPIYVFIFLLVPKISLCTFFFFGESMTISAMVTVAGSTTTLYLLFRRRKKAEEEWSRARTLRSKPAQVSSNLFESIMMSWEMLRFTYSEIIGKWPIADLIFDINSFMRKQVDSISLVSIPSVSDTNTTHCNLCLPSILLLVRMNFRSGVSAGVSCMGVETVSVYCCLGHTTKLILDV